MARYRRTRSCVDRSPTPLPGPPPRHSKSKDTAAYSYLQACHMPAGTSSGTFAPHMLSGERAKEDLHECVRELSSSR